jgi:uroporphyrin-III C-methyltransferase
MKHPAKVHLVGAGPGDPDLLTVGALRLLQEADVVVYDRLVSSQIMALVSPMAGRIAVGKAPGAHTVPQDKINRILIEQARLGHKVVRLKGGDPLVFGRGSEEGLALRAAGIAVEYTPGITAAQGIAAATGVPLTHRGLASGVRYVTGHRAKDAPLELDWAGLADPDTTVVVYMGAANMVQIADQLIAHGLPPETPVMAVSCGTTPQEQRVVSNLAEISSKVQLLPAPLLFVIGKVVSLYPASVVAGYFAQPLRSQEVAHA